MKLAVFDFDGTLFPHDTIPFLMRQWRKQGYPLFRLWAVYFSVAGLFIRYKLKLYKKAELEQIKVTAMQKGTRLFDGMTEEQVKRFFDESCKAIMPHINADVLNEVKETKKQGYHTVLLSGCYELFLEMVAKAAGMDAVIGTRLIYKNGQIDGGAPMDIVSGQAKVRKLREVFGGKDVDWRTSCAYADSYSDIELLRMVGHPIAVDPDGVLKEAAKNNGWRVIEAEK